MAMVDPVFFRLSDWIMMHYLVAVSYRVGVGKGGGGSKNVGDTGALPL